MSRTENSQLTELLSQDVDDLVRAAEEGTTAHKLAKVKLIASAFPSLDDEVTRLKAMSFLQAALGSLSTRTVPVGTANTTVDIAAQLTNAKVHAWDIRRVAYHVLGLVFLRVRSLTPKLDSEIRATFKAGKRDPHPSIRDFARRAQHGVLKQREAAGPKTFSTRIRHVVAAADGLRARRSSHRGS